MPLVKIWQHKKKRYYVIELPDKSHTRIPIHWADDGITTLFEIPLNLPFLTIDSIRQLNSLITTLENKISMKAKSELSIPHHPIKEDEYGKAAHSFQTGGK